LSTVSRISDRISRVNSPYAPYRLTSCWITKPEKTLFPTSCSPPLLPSRPHTHWPTILNHRTHHTYDERDGSWRSWDSSRWHYRRSRKTWTKSKTYSMDSLNVSKGVNHLLTE
jgi:hypothetical protein